MHQPYDYGSFVKGIATRHEKHKEYKEYTFLNYLEDVEEFQKDIAKGSKNGNSEQQKKIYITN